MPLSEAGRKVRSDNGHATVAKLREKKKQAHKDYIKVAKPCEWCGSLILPQSDKDHLHEVKKKRFCNSHCANSFTNPKWVPKQTLTCSSCGACITKRSESGLCRTCNGLQRRDAITFGTIAKGELFAKRGNWQSARSSIQRHARLTYLLSGRPQQCKVCHYRKHFQVSHVIDVSAFPDSSLMSEINNIDNLIALCPTHHWEFDHNALDERDAMLLGLVSIQNDEGYEPSRETVPPSTFTKTA